MHASVYVWLTGATGSHVMVSCYSAHLEDFAGSDMSQLDVWVFKAVKVRTIQLSRSWVQALVGTGVGNWGKCG